MNNEEFQSLVLSELRELRADVSGLKEGQSSLKEGQSSLRADVSSLKEGQASLRADVNSLKEGQKSLEEGQKRIEKKLDAVYNQTADLTEFKTEVNMKLNRLIEDNKSLHEIVGEHEVAIRTLRRLV